MDDSTNDLSTQLAAAWSQAHPGEPTPGETDTPAETPAAPKEETTVKETPPAEKPAEPKAEATQPKAEGTETELGVDDAGKQYIPKERFDKVYGKLKAYERGEIQPKVVPTVAAPQIAQAPQEPSVSPNETTALAIEMVKGKWPQFDPESDQYDPTLDRMALDVLNANRNQGMTVMQAAKKAMSYQKELAEKITASKIEARTVKAIQSDTGITNRVLSREKTEVDPSKMTLEQQEVWLKANGQW
jgi:hypothetical protein